MPHRLGREPAASPQEDSVRAKNLSLLTATLAFAMLAFVPSAHAATAQWSSVEITVHDEGSSSILMVTGRLPQETPLPAQVELSVPTGAEIQWSGEILGGDPSLDPSVTPEKKTADGLDLYSFTLTKSRVGQIEVVAPRFFSFDGKLNTGLLAWSLAHDVDQLRMSILVPAGAQISQMSPGAKVVQGDQNAQYVDQSFSNVKAGQEVTLSVNYTAASTPQAPTPSPSSSALPILIVLLVVVLGALFVMAVNRKLKLRSSNGDAEDDVEDDDDPWGDAEAEDSGQSPRVTPKRDLIVESTPKKGSNTALIITAGLITVAVAAGIMASQSASSVTEVPNGFSQEFSQGDACQSVTFELLGKPSKQDAKKLFDAVKAASPLRAVAYTDTPRIEVGFCESTTSQQAVQAALAPTGLIGNVVQGTPTTTP
jgi:hypothetical protein